MSAVPTTAHHTHFNQPLPLHIATLIEVRADRRHHGGPFKPIRLLLYFF